MPGGHIEENELPHQAAEREFFEETGIRVEAVLSKFKNNSTDVTNLPVPFVINLHWISKENYQQRMISPEPNKRVVSKKWPRGCEQHMVMMFLLSLVDDQQIDKFPVFKQNIEETDGIAWFSQEEIDDLETNSNIKEEIRYVFFLDANGSSHGPRFNC